MWLPWQRPLRIKKNFRSIIFIYRHTRSSTKPEDLTVDFEINNWFGEYKKQQQNIQPSTAAGRAK